MACRIKQIFIGENKIDLLHDGKVYDENLNIFTLLIGNNGCGKTRILKTIASYVTNDSHTYKDGKIVVRQYDELPSRTIVITNTIGDSFPLDNSSNKRFSEMSYVYLGSKPASGGSTKKNLIERAIRIFLENDITEQVISAVKQLFDFVGFDTHITIDYKFSKTFFQTSNLKCKDESNNYCQMFAMLNNYRHSIIFPNKEINSLYVNLQNVNECDWSGSLKSVFPSFQDFKEAIFALRREKYLNVKNATVKIINSDERFNFELASSGEANLLTNLLSLITLVKDNSLILIDEPELSMHPEWQLKYMQLLNIIIGVHSGCHVILATHSPFFVSDLEANSSTVVTLNRGKQPCEINSELLEYSPFAWSVENILLNVFNVPYTRNFYFAERMQNALALLSDHKRDTAKLKQEVEYIKSKYDNMSDNDPLKSVAQILIDYEKI